MGVLTAMGLLLGLYWWWKMARDENWEEIELFDVFFLSGIAFFVIGRVGYVAWHSEKFESMWQALSLLVRPGMEYGVGLLAALLMLTLFARAKEWEIWKVWDAAAVSLSLVLSFGSVGVLLNRGQLSLDLVGVVMAALSFVVTTVVRKNFRFYVWYKGELSVARDGLAALVGLVIVGIYLVLRAAVTGWTGLSLFTGIGIVLMGAVMIVRRSGQADTQWTKRVLSVVQWRRRNSRRR